MYYCLSKESSRRESRLRADNDFKLRGSGYWNNCAYYAYGTGLDLTP